MKLRQNFFPRSFIDWVSFLFILTVIGLFYWFDLFMVLPVFHEMWSLIWWLHMLFGTFVVTNIVSNLLATMMVDTSVFSVVHLMKNLGDANKMNFCEVCQCKMPARSWHCSECNKCILKRDHHCTFSGCCIGHYNHRFFFCFLLYFFIGCCYALYFNAYFVLTRVHWTFALLPRLIFPILSLAFGLGDQLLDQCLFIMLVLNVVGLLISALLLQWQCRLIVAGLVGYEHQHASNDRHLRKRYATNISQVLGRRWLYACLSPLLKSPLTSDGVHWYSEHPQYKIKHC